MKRKKKRIFLQRVDKAKDKVEKYKIIISRYVLGEIKLPIQNGLGIKNWK